MIAGRMSYGQAVAAFKNIQAATFRIERPTDADMIRMAEIMEQYSDAELDFADASLMAISERLNITTIYTFDRRDFGMFRPKHTDFLKLLP
jgi:predicted nucleic acid-binding protein